jgi:hypothetical protein
LFFICDAPCVLDLCELCGAFVVHLGLQISANLTVAFADHPENIGLVVLSGKGIGHLLVCEGLVLALNFG